MLKADKEKVVAELAERLRTAQTLIVADYRGLTMTEIDRLRTQLLEHGARFSVVKNTLTRRAAEAAGIEPLLALLEGPTAIAFLDADGDPIAVAKALSETARTTRVFTVRGGILDGKPIGEDEVKSLATLPPADQLRAQLAGALAAPLTTVVGLFTAPLRDLVGVLEARIAQLQEQGEAIAEPEVPAEEPAAEAEPEAEPEAEAEPEPEPEEEPQPEEPQTQGEES